jgi:dCMP deaminase
MERLSKIEWWMKLAEVSSSRSEDPYCKVGAVGVREDGSIAGASYNGAPPGIELGEIWLNRDERRKFIIHAETNLLRYIKPKECPIVAVTLAPCYDCLRNLAAYGVQKIYFKDLYNKCDIDQLATMSKIFHVELHKVDGFGSSVSF